MEFRLLLTMCVLGIGINLQGQENYEKGNMIDTRDGKAYQTIKINNTTWLAENLKFKTENSVFIDKNAFGINTDGYYYPYEETDEVCPLGFVIPNETDWEDYIQFLVELKNIPDSSIKHFSSSTKRATGSGIIVSDDKLQLFEDPNPLNLEISGVLQGDKLLSDDALTFWSRKDDLNDSKYHFHIFPNNYSNHTHKHNIIAKKKKKRKFVVRCIKKE